jgi:4-hydroxy-3-methylbut-2-enyl diphosphate reductase
MDIAERCDSLIVIGSSNSSNTRALERLANEAGCSKVYRVNQASEIPLPLSGTIGVTAGASAPEELVQEVLDVLGPLNGVEEIHYVTEEEYFPPPRELRNLIHAVGFFASLGFSDLSIKQEAEDRLIGASEVLRTLT